MLLATGESNGIENRGIDLHPRVELGSVPRGRPSRDMHTEVQAASLLR